MSSGATTVGVRTDVNNVKEHGQKKVLKHNWKFWFFEKYVGRIWEENLRVVCPFSTVEDFWSVYINLKCVSELRTDCSYFVFKDSMKPMWEDDGNRKGGRWIVQLDKRWRSNLQNHWLEVLLCVISDAFGEDGDDICGAAVDVRGRKDKISIWTSNCANDDRIINIGKKIKESLNLSMVYESHADSAVKSSSSCKVLFQL